MRFGDPWGTEGNVAAVAVVTTERVVDGAGEAEGVVIKRFVPRLLT